MILLDTFIEILQNEWLGIVASAFVLISFLASKQMITRIINSVGCVVFIVYGFLLPSYATAFMNSGVLVVHIVFFTKYFINRYKAKNGETFREMRRKKQQLTQEECVEILNRNTSGVLAVSGDEDYPYAVPMSYVYYGNALYLHCAKSGHKLDAIKKCNKVSFCVVDSDNVVPQEYTTYFRSVIIFGKAGMVEGDEALAAIEKLAIKYNPTDSKENRDKVIKKEYAAMCIIKIDIARMSGKQAVELAKSNKG